ncbi:MAG: endonuclease III domain-containing protein [Sphaerochaetaceae bacterium]|jgi:endonuclease-3
MDDKKWRATNTYNVLNEISPKEIRFLSATDPFQLLISVILTAQTTDAQVENIATNLFTKYPTAEKLADADIDDVIEIIRSTGFHTTKAKNIIATSQKIIEEFKGKVPLTMKELTSLNGVGRKSASVILGQIGNMAAIIVDTHFKRVVQRVGLTEENDPTKIEKEVALLLPEEKHYRYSMIVNYHGREICHARKPKCSICPIATYCRSYPIT